MLNKETLKKTIYIYENLSDRSIMIVEEYKKVLGITEKQAKAIITNNVTATVFIWNDNYLRLIGVENAVKKLIACTLFRQEGKLYSITNEEKEIIKKYYNIILDDIKE